MQRGFTLVELIATMVIVGVLAITISASFSRNVYDAKLVTDRIRSTISYAQKLAVSSRRVVTVNIASTTVTVDLCQQSISATSAACPALSSSITLPTGFTSVPMPTASVRLGTNPGTITSFKFDPQGRPDLSATLAVNIGDMNGATFVTRGTVSVELETGYAR